MIRRHLVLVALSMKERTSDMIAQEGRTKKITLSILSLKQILFLDKWLFSSSMVPYGFGEFGNWLSTWGIAFELLSLLC